MVYNIIIQNYSAKAWADQDNAYYINGEAWIYHTQKDFYIPESSQHKKNKKGYNPSEFNIA